LLALELVKTLDFKKFFVIAGPCVVESSRSTVQIACDLAKMSHKLKVPLIFKASYDKANRSSHKSFRGLGIKQGLQILKKASQESGLPVITDVHSIQEAEEAADIADVLQIPAFLCRQTDLLETAARTGKWVNVKKGQFLAPQDMVNVIAKLQNAGARNRILLTERGTTFGYHNLVVDFRGIPIMKKMGFPVIFDATHSVQRPGGAGDRSGGESEFIPTLAKAAVAAGCDGIFLETHPDPKKALSDGPNMIPLNQLPQLLAQILRIRAAVLD
jgi:2-dehydro-3-deoxyphosphooctonate aldolase (KDO 8-P synthase)